jgi:hypothetical protein
MSALFTSNSLVAAPGRWSTRRGNGHLSTGVRGSSTTAAGLPLHCVVARHTADCVVGGRCPLAASQDMRWPVAQNQRGHDLCGDESDGTAHHAHSC